MCSNIVCDLGGDYEPINHDPRMTNPTREAMEGGFLPHQNGSVGKGKLLLKWEVGLVA